MHAFSNYYQDLRPTMTPTFEKYLDPVPTIERQFVYETLTQMPLMGIYYSTKRYSEMYNEIQSATCRVDIKFKLSEIMAIRDMAMKNVQAKVSTMDCLAAYLITVLNKTETLPISRIFNVIGVRYK